MYSDMIDTRVVCFAASVGDMECFVAGYSISGGFITRL